MPRSNRFLTLIGAAFAMTSTIGFSQTVFGVDWQLVAIDGQLVDIPASLLVMDDGGISGKAPCNSWSSRNSATLPDLKLRGIRATRRACDRLDDEQRFFDALAVMDRIEPDGDRNLILTGPDGRSMEFVRDRTVGTDICKTCAAQKWK